MADQIKKWSDRMFENQALTVGDAMSAEIADLRAALQAQQTFQHPDGRCKRWCGDGECKEACVSPSPPVQDVAIRAQHGDALDAARWRFMMRAGDDENGAEAKALEASKLGDEAMETDRPASVQLAEIVDAAMLAARREG